MAVRGHGSPGYFAFDAERRAPEKPKRPTRDPYRRDRARVLHSWALRRLADKTQVLLPGESDFPRTRLTHTLEVSQVAREMGDELGCDPDIVDTAGLSHDLGHPPFGHNGETALNAAAAGIGGFEGNAQSFRVLTRLEPKVSHAEHSVGLNLTRASLDATMKYPWFRGAHIEPHGTPLGRVPDSATKFNVYPDDAEAFAWVREGAPHARPCLEAQVMDWADDVAYSVHDIEDAFYSGFISPGQLAPGEPMSQVIVRASLDSAGGVNEADLCAAHERLLSLPEWPSTFDHTTSGLASLKSFTSVMIGRFSSAAVDATLAAAGPGPLTRYSANLVVPPDQRAEVALLKAVSSHFVFHRAGVDQVYAAQRALLEDLVALLLRQAPGVLHPMFAEQWAQAPNEPGRLRVVIDQVASLTDVSAVRWHRRLLGEST